MRNGEEHRLQARRKPTGWERRHRDSGFRRLADGRSGGCFRHGDAGAAAARQSKAARGATIGPKNIER